MQSGVLNDSPSGGWSPGLQSFDVPMGGPRGRDLRGISIGSTTHPYSYSASRRRRRRRRRRRWPSRAGHLRTVLSPASGLLRRLSACALALGTRASPGPSVNFVSSITQYTVALMATGSNKH